MRSLNQAKAARSSRHFSTESEQFWTAFSAIASFSVTCCTIEEYRVISPLRCLIVFLRFQTSLLSAYVPLMALSLVISRFLSCSSFCWTVRIDYSTVFILELALLCYLPALYLMETISLPSCDRSLWFLPCSLLSLLEISSFSLMSLSLSWLALSNLCFHISTCLLDLSQRRAPSLIWCLRSESSRSFS